MTKNKSFKKVFVALLIAFAFTTNTARCEMLQMAKADDNGVDRFMGDWKGICKHQDGQEQSLAAQVIALGNGKYRANILGEFDESKPPIAVLQGQLEGLAVRLAGQAKGGDYNGSKWIATIEGGIFKGTFENSKGGTFRMQRVVRFSPTLGLKKPAGVVMLFDGTDFSQWKHPGGTRGFIALEQLMPTENCAAYLRSRIWSEENQEVQMQLGSDDGVKVWLNGRLLHTKNLQRPLKRNQDKVKATLNKGSNELLFKITNFEKEWGLCVRFTSIKGKSLNNIAEQDPDLAKESSQNPGTRQYLERNDGYLTVWEVTGPYSQAGKNASELLGIAFGPEQKDTTQINWIPLNIDKQRDVVLWNLTDDGAMEIRPGAGSIISKKEFGDCKLHIEFRTPFMPESDKQHRGNSGVYPQGRYEIQVLDSYGLESKDNECGGVYKVATPAVNMCAPPMQWQSYDITFYAPSFDKSGSKVSNAKMAVLHNGVKIHDNIEIPKPTGGGMGKNEVARGGLYLQDHGDKVQYRNIWLVEQ
ncbi:MAG: DUF1080 domain-containing protein [Sedimentisphaerales bacterium]|nr:DUF1080 domain-containing protein [Sedimentisphaerales bacterium]